MISFDFSVAIMTYLHFKIGAIKYVNLNLYTVQIGILLGFMVKTILNEILYLVF